MYSVLPNRLYLKRFSDNTQCKLQSQVNIIKVPNNDSFKNKLERNQYNAALTTTGAIQGTPRDKTYKELGLEFLQSRRCLHCLCTFHNIKATGLPSYLFKLIPDTSHHYLTRSVERISRYQCRTESFKSSFRIAGWCQARNLRFEICNCKFLYFILV